MHWHKIAGLPLTVEGYDLERRERPVSSGFTRVTTVVRLHGGGEEGVGEDVGYDPPDHDAFPRPGGALRLEGNTTLDGFSRALDTLELFPQPPVREATRHYRRWALESAALDLALRQAGASLAGALGLTPRPLRFVVSLRLGNPPSLDPVERLLRRRPELRFKLDPTSDWDAPLVTSLARTGAVEAVDLKGAYRGTEVDQPPDPELYRLVAEGFPDAWIEDPALTAETDAVLRRHRARITWDAPIHSVADIEALPFPPRSLNFKPSRFGTLAGLFAAYEHCASRGIAMYGGGQFELGPGRGQVQYLASLFHADGPNDVAPAEYNEPEPPERLPLSPLPPHPAPVGFRWGG